MTDTPQLIKLYELPSFSVDKIHTPQSKRRELRFKLIRGLIILGLVSCAMGRYALDKKFDKKMVEQHHLLDKTAGELATLKSQAFVNDNYKNKAFRKNYLSVHDTFLMLKKDHACRQTNSIPNVFFKHRGACPECLKLAKMGVRPY